MSFQAKTGANVAWKISSAY